ncbi:amidohydrolase family protein [Hoeflea sp. EC-HK425]|uniref:amidohydrolase family protein n=1 Tax=Hoeflea sp. EC-HK425 TaxID=2038388 RepID=UPI001256FF10|nr:amidohydrolase family protein [Hoeflea sp. EC-HK425]VVT22015.1 2-pyrone-4,6-dicarbaxylate hydrolase [Hoeflea sp. EC-HK425]
MSVSDLGAAGYLSYCATPKRPDFRVPEGAVDAHCHVFGPASRFPFAPERKYTPVDAPKEQLFRLRDHLGFSRNVIVQATCHGRNNDALVDALDASDGRARGVAVVGAGVTDPELDALDRAGVRGVRFNFLKRLVDDTPHAVFERIAQRVQPLGWHIVVYFEAQDLTTIAPLLGRLPGRIVVDHMGRPDVTKGVDGPEFARFIELMERNQQIWVKVSCPERLTVSGPPYDDVVPFAHRLVTTFPDRVLWGTDWPHPNMETHMPDDGVLTDLIPRIAPTESLQQALLVTNPMRLYWPEEMQP